MKLDKNKQSKNIEDRRGESSATAFKTDRTKNPAYLRVKDQREGEYIEYGEKVIKDTMSNKEHPLRKALKGMDKPQPKAKSSAEIPIPTPRPDPSKPYERPKVWTEGYNSQVTPGKWITK